MGKKMIKPLSIIMIFLVLLVTGCYDPFADQEIRYPRLALYDDIRAYTFEPKTILTALDRNDGEIFQPLPDWGQENIFPSGSFAWQQQDYLKIAIALNQVANQDNLDNLEEWSVYSINSSRDCADIPIGFDHFSITYFKTVGERYVTREMDVWPLAKEADWAGNMDFPRPVLMGWKSINLGKLKVTADDALQMAEANGGKAARQAVSNDCSISVALAPNADDADWGVYYFRGGSVTLFHFSIYPY
jgi:hypothetical protein